VDDRAGDSRHDAAHRDEHEHGKRAFGHDEEHGQAGETRARLPHEVQNSPARRARDTLMQRVGHVT
jgi:hypothetical protein